MLVHDESFMKKVKHVAFLDNKIYCLKKYICVMGSQAVCLNVQVCL
jgi:hypothetical protein